MRPCPPCSFFLFSFLLLAFAPGCQKQRSPGAAEPSTAAPASTAAVPTAASGEVPALPTGTRTSCAVSGEEFVVRAATPQVVHAGKRYAFCCEDCQADFEKNPAKFARK